MTTSTLDQLRHIRDQLAAVPLSAWVDEHHGGCSVGDPEALLRAFAASDPMVEVVHGEVDRCRFCEYVTGKWDHDGACPWRIAREWVADNPD